MPPSRRRNLGAQPPSPSRRPRVAGLRKPSPTKRATESPEPAEPTETSPETPDRPDALGEAPERAEDDERVEEADSPSPEPEPAQEAAGEEPDEPEPARPSPRAKVRDRGTERPIDAEQVDVTDRTDRTADTVSAGSSGAGSTETAKGTRRVGYPVLGALLAATLVLAGLAVFFKMKHSEVSGLVTNTALVDVASTTEVKQVVEDAAEQLMSVNYKDLDKTERAAERFLGSDEVRATYDRLMGEYREQAAEQKIVVTTTAVRSGVVVLDDDSARVMVYVDQVATRAGNDQPMGGPAALWFEVERRDGTWKVSDLNTYGSARSGTQSGSAPTGAEPSSSQAEDSTEGN
ncbi:hypothetical protein ACQPZU_02115 [Saccharomonospora azurea]|uniref:Mce-associated membrane protein n=1 Tax=Saccharomonospora azurea NA-128 TaxID=882081 RepID=H8GFK4_9PSEU|nr:hypothetical protein [Saccharomonospora azurea]EHY90066.1 hypothetical protein SacazDRAFT_03189 [Saccharomonospora azurea NA-128]